MSDELRNEISDALASLSDAELFTLGVLPSAKNRAKDALRHNQWLTELTRDCDEPLYRVEGLCVITGKAWCTNAYSGNLLFTGLRLWALGTTAQCALRFMSASEREFLISGISPFGWEETFPVLGVEDHEEPGDREPHFPAPDANPDCCNACGNYLAPNTVCRCEGTGNG